MDIKDGMGRLVGLAMAGKSPWGDKGTGGDKPEGTPGPDKGAAPPEGSSAGEPEGRPVPPKSKGDYAFITHMIEIARRQSGRVAVIVPHGVLFRGGSEGKIRQALIEENLLDAVVGVMLAVR